MKKVVIRLALAGLLLTLIGCIGAPPRPTQSQLEIREFQTHEYPVRDSKRVMKALLDVLQDDGYIVKNAVVDLGLLTATREIDLEDSSSAIFRTIFMGENARWEKNSEIEVSVNVSKTSDGSKVRANFQRKVLDNRGDVLSVERVDEPDFYRSFFSKVDKGLFLSDQRL